MRVLQLIDSLEAGGAERVAVNFANALSFKVEKSFLCTSRKEGILKQSLNKEVDYLFLKKKRAIDLRAINKLRTFVKDHNVDIIHAHSSSFFIATILKILTPKKIIIWHEHYGNRDQSSSLSKLVLKICSRFFSSIIAVNQKLKNRSEQKLLCKSVYVLVNYPVFNLNMTITSLEGEIGKRIICLANLRPDKDHVNLLKAFKEVVKQKPDWTLHLVGKDFFDDYSLSIKAFIIKNKLKQHVYIYGSRSDISNILNQSTIGVLSSKSEGLPLTLLEYGFVGLPSVATNVGDCSQVISSKNEGFLIEPKNSKELANVILRLVADEKLRQKLGDNLFKKVNKTFSEERVISQLMMIYEKHL